MSVKVCEYSQHCVHNINSLQACWLHLLHADAEALITPCTSLPQSAKSRPLHTDWLGIYTCTAIGAGFLFINEQRRTGGKNKQFSSYYDDDDNDDDYDLYGPVK